MIGDVVSALRLGAFMLGCFLGGLTITLTTIRLRELPPMPTYRVIGTWLFVLSYLLLIAYVLADIYPRLGREQFTWRPFLATAALGLSLLALLVTGWDDITRLVLGRRRRKRIERRKT